ncbi:MAG TPA: gluconokinase [Marmoricola sp.]
MAGRVRWWLSLVESFRIRDMILASGMDTGVVEGYESSTACSPEAERGGWMGSRIVVGGVSGSGKSTVGRELAQRLGLPFADGDDFHSKANVDKMTAGIALTDEDRRPWLVSIGEWLSGHEDGGVVACSALRRSYRDLIRHGCPDMFSVQLTGDRGLIERRQAARHGHFMPTSLMDSQWATFEPLQDDEAGVVVDVGPPPRALVDQVLEVLQGSPDRR